ncbi:MAG: hypothetical protein COV76_06520 [Candidatus Omnitrophica bacterium CG11_big_fil_rev_8_21_14_0_20_64_10]|nr:MAG: hypothetical protein COV76_06520 [Candidatus Omnitrophica bacterium CG11_big_fil_rev_8_21_14_0_20_64_10]
MSFLRLFSLISATTMALSFGPPAQALRAQSGLEAKETEPLLATSLLAAGLETAHQWTIVSSGLHPLPGGLELGAGKLFDRLIRNAVRRSGRGTEIALRPLAEKLQPHLNAGPGGPLTNREAALLAEIKRSSATGGTRDLAAQQQIVEHIRNAHLKRETAAGLETTAPAALTATWTTAATIPTDLVRIAAGVPAEPRWRPLTGELQLIDSAGTPVDRLADDLRVAWSGRPSEWESNRPAVVDAALSVLNGAVLDQAILAARLLGNLDAIETVPALLARAQALGRTAEPGLPQQLRNELVWALARIGQRHPETVAEGVRSLLLEAAASEGDTWTTVAPRIWRDSVRVEAVTALAGTGNAEVAERLMSFLVVDPAQDRGRATLERQREYPAVLLRTAAEQLGVLGRLNGSDDLRDRIRTALEALLPVTLVQSAAAAGLARLGDPAALPALRAAIPPNPVSNDRRAAVHGALPDLKTHWTAVLDAIDALETGTDATVLSTGLLEGNARDIRVRMTATPNDLGRIQAAQVMTLWDEAAEAKKPFAIGLATGSTPQPLLTELARRLNDLPAVQLEDHLKRLFIVAMDDLVDPMTGANIPPDHERSAVRFFRENFFDQVEGFDFSDRWTQIHLIVPTVGEVSAQADRVRKLGGIRWQLMATDPNELHVAQVHAGDRFGDPAIQAAKDQPRELSSLFLQHNPWAAGFRGITFTLDDFLNMLADDGVVSLALFGKPKRDALGKFAAARSYNPDQPITFLWLPNWDAKRARIHLLIDEEVSKPIKEKLTAGLEAAFLNARLPEYTWTRRLLTIGAIWSRISRPGQAAVRRERFRRLFGEEEADPREGDLPEIEPEGVPDQLKRWLADDGIVQSGPLTAGFHRTEAVEETLRMIAELNPYGEDRLVELTSLLPSVAAFNEGNPQAAVELFGIREFDNAVGSFKIRQYVHEILHSVANAADPAVPHYGGIGMFSTGNGIRAAAAVVEHLIDWNILPEGFQITMVSELVNPDKLAYLQPYVEKGILVMKPVGEVAEAYRATAVTEGPFAGIPTEGKSLDNINTLLRLMDWWTRQNGLYHVKASESFSAAVGGISMAQDLDTILPDADVVIMPTAGGIPGVGLATGFLINDRQVRVISAMSAERPASIGSALNIQNIQPLAVNGSILLGAERNQVTEVSDFATIKGVVDLEQHAGLKVEVTSAVGLGQVYQWMAQQKDFLEQLHRQLGRRPKIALLLTGQNRSKEDVALAHEVYKERGLENLVQLEQNIPSIVAAGLEAGTALANLSGAAISRHEVAVVDPANADLALLLSRIQPADDPVVLITAGLEHEAAVLKAGFTGITLRGDLYESIEQARAAAAALFAGYTPRFYRGDQRPNLLGWLAGLLERYNIPESLLSVQQAADILQALDPFRSA